MRLLLAEDEKELSRALKVILEHNNYSVDAVYNGADADDYIMTGIYDGIILDIMMPKKDGISVLKDMRSRGDSTPVILLTAKSEIDDRVLGLDSGADDYLTKPFSSKELLARIRAMTRRKGDTTDSILKFANLTLDRTTYEMKTNDGCVKLANKDFQMLEMMMEHPSQIISADTFMDKIWGFDSDAEQNVVWVYISNLRKKLVSINSTAQIKVARNVGYYLEEKND